MALTLDTHNYHSLEANREYMSSHQYGNWVECPAREWATLRGDWVEPPKAAFEVGGYADMRLTTPDEHDDWMAEHGHILDDLGLRTKKGAFGAEMRRIDAAVTAAWNEPLVQEYLEGEKQVIKVFEMFDVKWRSCLDIWSAGHDRVVDIKTAAELHSDKWVDTRDIFTLMADEALPIDREPRRWGRGDFWAQFGYVRQGAIYRFAAGDPPDRLPDFYLLTLGKDTHTEKYPEQRIIHLDDKQAFQDELNEIGAKLPTVLEWKHSATEPPRCENRYSNAMKGCLYCRSTKQLAVEEIQQAMVWR